MDIPNPTPESLDDKRKRLAEMTRNFEPRDLDLVESDRPLPDGVSEHVRLAHGLWLEIRNDAELASLALESGPHGGN